MAKFADDLGITAMDLLGMYLAELVKIIEEQGYIIKATWADEHGGLQSVAGGVKLSLESQAKL